MKKIGDYLIERLKLNDDSKIKKEDIIKAYEQNHLLFKYGGAIIKAEELWVMMSKIEILEALGKIIDNTNECLDGCYLIFYSGIGKNGFHIYDSSFDDDDYVWSDKNEQAHIGTILMHELKKGEKYDGTNIEFVRKDKDVTSSQLSIIKKLEAYIQPKNKPFNN